MTIQTKFHGTLAYSTDQLWNFPKGLPGFEAEKNFILLPIEGNDTFQVLQSIESPSIAFIVANPYTLIEDYTFTLDESTIELLKIEKEADVFVLAVLSLKQPFEASTINLQAPLIFQINNRTAKQMILNDTQYSIRQPLKQLTDKGGK